MNGIIIGGGIAGLSAGIALQRRGFDVKIMEASETQRHSDLLSGVRIAPNGMAVLQRIDTRLDDEVRDRGKMLLHFDVTDYKGKILHRIPYETLIEKYGYGFTAVHRQLFIDILTRYLEPGTVIKGKKCTEVSHLPSGKAVAFFEDGSAEETDFLLGADGYKSAVRKYITGEVPRRYSGQTCWRGMTSFILPPEVRDQHTEIWGKNKGSYIGFSQISSVKTDFYAINPAPAGQKDEPGKVKDRLHDLFREISPVFHEVLASTDEESIFRSDLYDFEPLETWHKGRIVLLGNAVHTVLPNLLQGANQALESAYILADCLAGCDNERQLNDAFERYVSLRKKKTEKIIKTAYKMAHSAVPEKSIFSAVKGMLDGGVAPFLTEKQEEEIFKFG